MSLLFVSAALACWPAFACDLPDPVLTVPDTADGTRVFVVAGHGNGTRTGNRGVYQQVESDVALDITLQLAGTLDGLAAFDVTLGRQPGESPSYGTRLARLERSGAVCLIDVHTDSRPEFMYEWTDDSGTAVWRNDRQPGFAVLFNESGPLGPERRRLARALARGLAGVGLPPYTLGYGEMYDADDVPGVYIDRRGLMMLRAPEVPSVIVETHHALDVREAARWRETETREAFAVGMANGLWSWIDGGSGEVGQ